MWRQPGRGSFCQKILKARTLGQWFNACISFTRPWVPSSVWTNRKEETKGTPSVFCKHGTCVALFNVPHPKASEFRIKVPHSLLVLTPKIVSDPRPLISPSVALMSLSINSKALNGWALNKTLLAIMK